MIGRDLKELPHILHLEIKGRTFSPQGSTGSGVALTVAPGRPGQDFNGQDLEPVVVGRGGGLIGV